MTNQQGESGFAALRRSLWHLRKGGIAQLRTHLRRQRLPFAGRGGARRTRAGLTFDPWPVADATARAPRRSDVATLRVGVILDDFSLRAFGPEWQQVVLTPNSWREELSAGLDLLFVESAWNGNGGAWQYHLTGASAPRPAFVELVSACRDAGVPTVFWNKEDPVHFDDFLDATRLFDRVYTTDVGRVPAYAEALGHDRVGVLPFAAQPVIHNPVRLHGRGPERDVAFAGMYFAHKYPERREQMDMLLGAAVDASPRMERGLEIFSRFRGRDEKYQFPSPFAERVVGSLDYDRMLTAYREYKVFLNVNSVVDSPSMCARRIFEITACGTPVVSAPSAAVGKFFPGDEVFVAEDRAEASATIRALANSKELRDRAVHKGQRRIWREHTYSARARAVLHDVGLAPSATPPRPSVTALVSTNRPHQLDHVLAGLGAQREVDLQIALLAHGFEMDEDDIAARAKDAGVDNLTLVTAGADVPLGGCLNLLLDVADGDVVAKIDDDDRYGPHYLSDQLYALDYSRADVVGKQAHYMYLSGPDLTLLRFADREHRYTDRVMGPTIVAGADVARRARFPEVSRGEDTGFLERVTSAGGRVYSTDRFNFVQMRSAAGGHSWRVSDTELQASGEVTFYGRADEHVVF
ncbi:glycosyltransferase family protein [Myceligenerans pegani]|uniref:Glycosyltransferase n=1 Tax=Myceligenerans pegani TaxID=2776917 RepID=A0ABR9N204_9MICO|nr:glycosyltransferase [Myceligenerans sp. TRM 65318]MBE1877118.1 glycosyltransferase [Myceligenerans sp. TRM 65318]MBE3019389.1 glycosyltransferase [Myceligenerans sp. TRM 65318]